MTTIAESYAQSLAAAGVARVYGLCGGHIQPLWDAISRGGIEIVDVRHEASAVYMAHADAALHGIPGVALVTSGPGLANAVTAIANAFTSGERVLVITGCPPLAQLGRGAMQELPHKRMVEAITTGAESVVHPLHAQSALHNAWAACRGGVDGRPGPAMLEVPADLWNAEVGESVPLAVPENSPAIGPPDPRRVAAAVALLAPSRRVLVIAGSGARGASEALSRFLDSSSALYLDTGGSRGVLPANHPAAVPAVRGTAMAQADLVITVGRSLDYQLAYGSPAAFARDASFLRIGTTHDELSANRRGEVEIWGNPIEVLDALATALEAVNVDVDEQWVQELRTQDAAKRERLANLLEEAPPGADGGMHPYRLIGALNAVIEEDSVVVADGGDILSFARVALGGRRYMDCGPLGCLGVGVPFGVVGGLEPGRAPAVALIGDGSLGFTAMDLDTARRCSARTLFVVANNAGWNIERMDQIARFDGNVVGVDLPNCNYAAVAGGLGLHTERVERIEELHGAIRRSLLNLPALLDVRVTRDAYSPDFLSGLAEVLPLQALRRWDEREQELVMKR